MSTYFIRQKKDRDYTVVDNTYLKDENLTWKAKGLFTYLLSLPEDWEIYLEELSSHAMDGIDSLRSAVRELERLGYIKRFQTKDANGKFASSNYNIIERPQESPLREKPLTGKPFTENPMLLSTNKQSTKRLSTNTLVENKKTSTKDQEISHQLATRLFNWIKKNYPDRDRDESDIPKWAVDIEKIHRIDKKTWDDITEIIDWSQKHHFWHQNIKSGKKLRIQFEQLMDKKYDETQPIVYKKPFIPYVPIGMPSVNHKKELEPEQPKADINSESYKRYQKMKQKLLKRE